MERMAAARGLHWLQRVEAITFDDAEVAALCTEFPGKAKGYHANACSHSRVWEKVALLDAIQCDSLASTRELPWGLVLEDDVCLHQDWQSMLEKATAAIGRMDLASEVAAVDCFLLDGLFVTGEASAEFGWLGPPQEGPHLADGLAFSDAYACTPEAARWLLERRNERPGSSTESYLMQLAEERGRCWTHLPRLALQRWDEDASSVCAQQTGNSMRDWYTKNYFKRFPWSLYAA